MSASFPLAPAKLENGDARTGSRIGCAATAPFCTNSRAPDSLPGLVLSAEQTAPCGIAERDQAQPTQEHVGRFRHRGSCLNGLEQHIVRACGDEDILLDPADTTGQSKKHIVGRSTGDARSAPRESGGTGARVDIVIFTRLYGADLELDVAQIQAPKIDANVFLDIDLMIIAARSPTQCVAHSYAILVTTVILAIEKARGPGAVEKRSEVYADAVG